MEAKLIFMLTCGIACMIVFIMEGFNEAVVPPIYPLHAKSNHNVSHVIVNFTMSTFYLMNLIGATALLFFTSVKYLKCIFILGIIGASGSFILFGFIDYAGGYIYIYGCILARCIGGLFVAFMWGTSFSLITATMGRYSPRFIALFSVMYYIGCSMGGSVSVFIKNHLNYPSAFLFSTGIEFCMLLLIVFMPYSSTQQGDDNHAGSEVSIFEILSLPGTWLLCLVMGYLNLVLAFLEGNLAELLTHTFQIENIKLLYLIGYSTLMPSSLISSLIVDRGFGLQFTVFSFPIFMFLLGIICCTKFIFQLRTLLAMTTLLAFLNIPRAMVCGCLFAGLDAYLVVSLPDKDIIMLRALIAPLQSACVTVGYFIGYLFCSGFLIPHFGFYPSLLSVVLCGFLISLITLLYFIKTKLLLKRHLMKYLEIEIQPKVEEEETAC